MSKRIAIIICGGVIGWGMTVWMTGGFNTGRSAFTIADVSCGVCGLGAGWLIAEWLGYTR